MKDLVLVTGGAGFIGSHLIPKLLSSGFKVRVLDSLSSQIHGDSPVGLDFLYGDDVEFILGNVVDRDTWTGALKGVAAIVHLAAETGTGQSMYEVARYNEVNSQGTALMLDVLGKSSTHRVKRVILTSSRSVYGEGAYINSSNGHRVTPVARSGNALAQGLWEPVCELTGAVLRLVPTIESDQIAPSSIYAATKYAQEDLVRIGCGSMGIGYCIFRLQNVYGERQSLSNPYTGILSIFSTKIRMDSELPLFEDGEESRDFIHVDDVTDALLRGLTTENPINSVVNVGSGVPTSVREVAEELSRSFGKTPNVVVTGEFRIGDIRHNYADISRMKDLLGLVPKVSLKEGLRRFADWVQEQPLPEDRLEQANQELRDRKLMN
ncbi:NAD-dependent epimerase/dehydratase family protein [Pseudomonas sp. CCC3.2]|uniref:NAD-dependent epimerase/dehydratase family protein n=1 Tax=unclassified Pseudomonas TaxID=196821 RepID=UPI002AB3AD68|nr:MULTISPECIES: NAD-dependent epimerase/dehydratase family protein [unclassified Pseudomonas]MDY7561396.1 NAD-dependent epimerase/dehydratase family protein [Pseudomonas sp. AB6]MEB0178928.1 NAD-dependent epimerase/dehydratase family protein [Pseudomonas sp. CCC3.2]MEB0210192.1 NAD-dependent epimerase/dehydratase family protein [Pseudomonas sp. AB6]